MNNIKSDLYYNDDHTAAAVLVSPGFGAGWSTWNTPELAWRKEIVEFWMAHREDAAWMHYVEDYGLGNRPGSEAHEEAKKFFQSIGYDEDNCPYFGGFEQIELVWVPLNTPWRIEEYDGSESLVLLENENYTIFN